MAIDGGLRDKLEPGTVLVARYKGTDYTAEVVPGEDDKVRFRLADGREFKSPSAAGSAVMDGKACNGWRWWGLRGDAPTPGGKASTAKAGAKRSSKPKAAKTEAKPGAEPQAEPQPEEVATA